MDGSWLKILLNKLMISGYPYFRCSFIINGKSYKNEWFRYFRKPPCIPHKANQTSLARPALGGAGRLFSLLLHRPEAQGIWAITSRATRLPRLKTGSHGGSPCLTGELCMFDGEIWTFYWSKVKSQNPIFACQLHIYELKTAYMVMGKDTYVTI